MDGDGTVFDRIGGYAALTAVVDDLYVRILDDPELAGFFSGTNLSRLKGKQVEFFAAALGGPDPYQGVGMREIHQGRGIGQEHFNLVAQYLVAALGAAGVDDATVSEIIGAVAPLSGDIVSSPAA